MSSHHLNTLVENRDVLKSRSYDLHDIHTLQESSHDVVFQSFDLEEEDENFQWIQVSDSEEEKAEEEEEEEEEEEDTKMKKKELFQTKQFLTLLLNNQNVKHRIQQQQQNLLLLDKTLNFMDKVTNLNLFENVDSEIQKVLDKNDLDISAVPRIVLILKDAVQKGVKTIVTETKEIEMQIIVETLQYVTISLFTENVSPLYLLSEKYEKIKDVVDSSLELLSSPSIKETVKKQVVQMLYNTLCKFLQSLYSRFFASKKKKQK